MSTIKDRILNKDLMNFTEEEANFIVQNSDLSQLLIKEIENGTPFNLDYSDEFVEMVITQTDFDKLLNNMLINGNEFLIEAYADFSDDSLKDLEEYVHNCKEKMLDFYGRNKELIINLIMDNIDNVNYICNIDIINELVHRGIYRNIPLHLSDSDLTSEIEDYIINGIDNGYTKVFAFSPRIFDYCKENNLCHILSIQYKEHPEIAPYILKEMENGLITHPDQLDYRFTREYENDYEVIKYKLENYKYIDNIDLDNRPELIPLVANNIKKFKRSYLSDKELMIPELFNAYLEVCTRVSIFGFDFDDYKEALINSKNHDINALTKSLSIYLDNNVSDNVNFIFKIIKYNLDDDFFSLLTHKISSLTFMDYASLIKRLDEDLVNKINRYEKYFNFTITEVEPRMNLMEYIFSNKVKYQIIKVLNKEQLIPSLIPHDYYSTDGLKEAIVERLAELKSDRFNSDVLFNSFDILFENPTPKMLSIILREDNPLGMSFKNKADIIKNSDSKYYSEFENLIMQSSTINIGDVLTILYTLLNNKYEYTSNFMEENIDKDNLIKVLNIIKNKEIEPIDNIQYSNLERFIRMYSNNDIYKEEIQPVLKDILLRTKDVPLFVSILFDEELRKTSTYSYETLGTSPKLYNISYNAPLDFIEFVKSAIDKKVPVDYLILDKVRLTDRFKETEITYNDANLNYYATSILMSGDSEDFRKFLLEIEPGRLVEAQQFNFLSRLYNDEEKFKVYFELTKDLDLSYDASILKAYYHTLGANKYKDSEFNLAIQNYILNLIRNNKMFTDNSMFSAELLQINEPEIEEFIVNNFFYKATNFDDLVNKNLFNQIKYKDVYYKALLERFNREPSLLFKYKSHVINDENMINIYTGYISNNNDQLNYYNMSSVDYLPIVMETVLKARPSFVSIYITNIIHYRPDDKITDEQYNILANCYCEYKQLPIENFDILHELYGNDLIKLLEVEDIATLLGKDSETIRRFVEIFKVRKMDVATVEAVNDSIKQHTFTNEHPEVVNIFTNTLEKIQQGITEEDAVNIISELCTRNDKGKYIYLPNNLSFNVPNNISEEDREELNNLNNIYMNDKEAFFRRLFVKIRDNQNIYSPLLHFIASYYIAEKRNEVNRAEDIYVDTNISFTYDLKQQNEAAFKYLIKNKPDVIVKILSFLEIIYGDDISIHYDSFKVLRKDTEGMSPEQIQAATKNIKDFKKLIIENMQTHFRLEDVPRSEYKPVNKIPYFKERTDLYKDVNNINFETVSKLLDNDEKYNCLITTLNKLKPLEWHNIFEDIINQLSVGEDQINIYNFINAFNTIYEVELKNIKRQRMELIESTVQEMRNNNTPAEEIDKYVKAKQHEPINVNINAYQLIRYAVMYSSLSNSYKVILGLEDFDLVKRNDEPYSASSGTMEQRLEYDSRLMLKLMENNEITIPSFVYDYSFEEEDKHKLQILVGCRGDARNLTQGERTGACMRAYGYAHDLFAFTNSDPRGFHITFTDPETGKYISRVSGFRNGNTVFLNQLRHSLDKEHFSNDDLFTALQSVGNELIERSKNSEMPIENVVVSPCYALEGYHTVRLSENEIGRDVYSGYKDVSQNAVVVATVGENNVPVPLKLDGKNQPIYKPCRLPIKYYSQGQITDEIKVLIQRIDAIKECLENPDDPNYYKIMDLDIDNLDTKYKYVIIGQDFYVALTEDNRIIKNIAIESEEANLEYGKAIEQVEQLKLGGQVNGKGL